MASTQAVGGGRLILSESRQLRLGTLLAFYFAQGLPIGLFLTAIAAWIGQNGADAADVALLLTTTFLPWSFKFVGAAVMDRYTLLAMGRRRVWLIGSQALILAGFVAAALAAPGPGDITLLAALGFAIFTGSAMQDVAVDGLAVDLLPEAEQGVASAFMAAGQVFGLSCGAMLGGLLLGRFGSQIAFAAFLPPIAALVVFAVLVRERRGEKRLPWSAGAASPEAARVQAGNWLAILKITLRSLLLRESIVYVVAAGVVRMLYGVFLAMWPVYATGEAGWSTEDYAAMFAALGLGVAVFGMVIGSWSVAHWGPRRAAMVGAALFVVPSGGMLLWPELGLMWAGLVGLIALSEGANMLFAIATNPIRMRLSDKRVAATQFTIYNSLSNLPVPAGAWLLAWSGAAGGRALTMALVVALAVVGVAILMVLRVGNREDAAAIPPAVPELA